MEKLIVMTKKELEKYALIDKVIQRRVSQVNTAEMLGISDRHFRRLLKAYREEGASGLLSKRRGKPSNNRKPEKEKNKASSKSEFCLPSNSSSKWRKKAGENCRI